MVNNNKNKVKEIYEELKKYVLDLGVIVGSPIIVNYDQNPVGNVSYYFNMDSFPKYCTISSDIFEELSAKDIMKICTKYVDGAVQEVVEAKRKEAQ